MGTPLQTTMTTASAQETTTTTTTTTLPTTPLQTTTTTASGCPGLQCPTEWTKINLQEGGVPWGAKDDRHGRWGVTSRVCGRKLKLLHRSGYVTCDIQSPYRKSNWGCSPGVGQPLAAHVTVG